MTTPRYCVVGAGAAGLAAVKVLHGAGLRGRLLRADGSRRRSLAHRLRVAAPDHVARRVRLRRASRCRRSSRSTRAATRCGPTSSPSRTVRPAAPHHASAPRSPASNPRGRPASGAGGWSTSDGRRTPLRRRAGRERAPLGPERPRDRGRLHGPVPALLAVPQPRRRQGRPRARRRRRQLRLRPRGGRRHRTADDGDLRATRPGVPAEGDLRQAAGGADVADPAAAGAAGARDPSPRPRRRGPPEVYRGLPVPATRNLNEQPPVVNNLLLYWIQHGRIDVVPGIRRHRRAGRALRRRQLRASSTRSCGPPASGPRCRSSTRALLRWEDGVPLRVAGLTVPVGLQAPVLRRARRPARTAAAGLLPAGPLVARLLRLTEAGESLTGRLRSAGPGQPHRHRAAGLERPDERGQRRSPVDEALEKAS